MPFQSEKQRKYLWLKEPKIARKWTDEYGSKIVKKKKKKKNKGGIMTRGVGYAPTAGKAKTIATPDVNRNNKPVAKSGDKKDKQSMKKLFARQQKPVTWT